MAGAGQMAGPDLSSAGWARAAAKQSPRPPTTRRKEFLDG
jgi:hypothetical protein